MNSELEISSDFSKVCYRKESFEDFTFLLFLAGESCGVVLMREKKD